MTMKYLAAVGVAALFILAAASPASADQSRALPEGETLFAIDCQRGDGGQLASVDVSSAVATFVGIGGTESRVPCAADATSDPTSGKIYWGSQGAPHGFFSMDPSTGVSTYIGNLTNSAEPVQDINGLMMGPTGVLYVVFSSVIGEPHTNLGVVDKATGAITMVAHLNGPTTSISLYIGARGSDYDPHSGKFYIINGTELLEVNVATGEVTSHGVNNDSFGWLGLAFDSNGVMWTTGRRFVYSSTVEGWATAGTMQSSANGVAANESPWFAISNVIIHPATETASDPVVPTASVEVLASTGVETTAPLATVGVLLSIGIALLVGRRRLLRRQS